MHSLIQSSPILVVITSHDMLGTTGERTGFHYEELATPFYAFRDAGYAVELASIAGGPPPHDPSSLDDDIARRPASVQRFLTDAEAMAALHHSARVDTFAAQDAAQMFQALYFPGGHGTMWDLPGNPHVRALVEAFAQAGKPVAAVCHGPAALVDARRPDGTPLVKDKRINCFTDAEERLIEKDGVMPFLLESRLREMGCRFEHAAAPFAAHVAADFPLFTGQNPESAAPLAEVLLAHLRQAAAA